MNGEWRRDLAGDGAVRLRAGRAACALGLAAGLLAGCGGAGSASPPAASSTVAHAGTVATAADGVQEVTLQTQDDYVFTPDHFTVAPGKVRLTVVNVATQLTHNFRFVPGKGPEEISQGISLLTPGSRETIAFTVQKPGQHPFECSFHTQLGQVGMMTVKG